MLKALDHPSSWTGKAVLLLGTVIAMNLHAGGAPERALAAGGLPLILGTVMGLGMLAIVVARLLGKNIGLIRSDRQAMGAMLLMIAVKIAVARVLLPL